jgi:hypothetical protein
VPDGTAQLAKGSVLPSCIIFFLLQYTTPPYTYIDFLVSWPFSLLLALIWILLSYSTHVGIGLFAFLFSLQEILLKRDSLPGMRNGQDEQQTKS